MNENTFFTEDSYEKDIDLETNEDVLERIYNDNIPDTSKLSINFAFITDTIDKSNYFADALRSAFKNYKGIEVKPYDELFEIIGITDKIQMTLEEINKWNQIMWDFGYKYDCKLDGWYVGD
jgi:cystathionine beta-lyase family protein involved in aluminum resistance